MTSYTVTLTQQELQIVGQALAQLPYNQVAPLMAKLQQQVDEQEAPDQAE